jgi:hypothetical protein
MYFVHTIKIYNACLEAISITVHLLKALHIPLVDMGVRPYW